ncbi:MAG: SRPBCC family protein [Rhodospirillaceae bacterium]
MDFTGTYDIPAPRQKVWDSINDPEILKVCIDGCEELNKTSDTEFDGKVKVKVGPVKAKFSGTVVMEDINAPQSVVLRVSGSGGVAGFAKGTAAVSLEEIDATNTRLTYEAKADVGGKLASVGARLVKGVADKTANQFFSALSAQVGEEQAESAAATDDAPAAAAEEAAADAAAEPSPAPTAAPAAAAQPAPEKPATAASSPFSNPMVLGGVAVVGVLVLLMLI